MHSDKTQSARSAAAWLAAAVLLASRPTSADEPPAPAQSNDANANPLQAEESLDDDRDTRLDVTLDSVFGGGKTSATVARPAGATTTSTTEQVRFTSFSWLLTGLYAILPSWHVSLGVQLPYSRTTLYPDGKPDRQAGALGNAALIGRWQVDLSRRWNLSTVLGALGPTSSASRSASEAQGSESSQDAYASQRASSGSRGGRSAGLFERRGYGGLLAVDALYHRGRFEFEPDFEIDSLRDTTTPEANRQLVTTTLGVRGSYRLSRPLDVGLETWVTTAPSGDSERKSVTAVAQPEARLHWGPVLACAGVVLPYAGPVSEQRVYGIRLVLQLTL
jgi:hypothetical protein